MSNGSGPGGVDPKLAKAVAEAEAAARKAETSEQAAAKSAVAAHEDAEVAKDGTKEKRPHKLTIMLNGLSVVIAGVAMGLAI